MEKLQNTLSSIHSLHLHSYTALKTKDPILYHELYTDISNFITQIVFRSHKNRINLMALCNDFGINSHDIHMDCLIRIMDKLDKILAKDAAFWIPCLYKLCNRVIIDTYYKASRINHTFVSLNKTLESYEANADSKKSKFLEDIMADKKTDVESDFLAKETAIEFYKKYAGNADSLLCSISSRFLGNKPAELGRTLLRTGSVDAALTEYIDYLCSLYHIDKSELPAHAPAKQTGITKVLSRVLAAENISAENISAKTFSAEESWEKEPSKELTRKISNITNRTK